MNYRNKLFFFFNDTATTEIYTLSLHDALPIFLARVARIPRVDARLAAIPPPGPRQARAPPLCEDRLPGPEGHPPDRKSTRLNSSHTVISYAVFCLKKKNNT